jgi:hypothetical protein
MSTKKQRKANEELLKTIRERHNKCTDADSESRQAAMEDMKFIHVPGCQWDDNMKQERGDRPCYEFNKIRVTAKRIINEMRANRPQGKVRGVEDSDKELAEIYEGIIRNIWNVSDGDTITDNAGEYQVSGGMGAWRITTDYAADDSFDQEIMVESIPNPFCLYADKAAKDPLKRDAKYFILTDRIATTEYEQRWPNAEKVNFEASEYDDESEWMDDEFVRIVEYWWKEPMDKEILQLDTGEVIDAESDEAPALESRVVNRRTVKSHKVKMCIASGEAILEGPTDWAGKELPFVMVYGEYIVIDGKIRWFGIGKFAKDAQRSYNVSRTAITETIAQAPQAKWWATGEQAKGQTNKWAEAHKKNFPFLLYNADPKAPGPPLRMGGADVPIALIQESQIASEEIKSVTGIFSPDLGAGDQAKSGIQERERRAQGQLATFNYQDNMSKGVARTWEILVDLIPKVYDTERELRVLGSDEAESYVKINQFVPDETGEMVKVNDLSQGRYDVAITVGPNFTTRRQEAAETYQALAQGNPEVWGVAGDLIFRSLDLPYAEDIAERLKTLLPPQIQSLINEDKQVPPEVQAMMQQAEQAMMMVQEQAAQVQQAAQEAEMDKVEVEKLIANLQKEEAQFEAKIAKELARLSEKESQLVVKEVTGEREALIEEGRGVVEQERQALDERLAQEMALSVQSIQQMAAQFNEYAVGVMQEIARQKDEKPKVVRVDPVREKGRIVSAVPIYEGEEG